MGFYTCCFFGLVFFFWGGDLSYFKIDEESHNLSAVCVLLNPFC